EDLPQILAARRLRADGGLTEVAARGAVIFAVCAGYQLVGTEFGGAEGEPVPGLSLIDISSGRGDRRGVGEIVADVDPELGVPQLTGFENHQGMTRIGPGARPPGSASAWATATAPRAPTRAAFWAPTCTARPWSGTPAWPTCCSPGRQDRCRRCPPNPRTGPASSAASASPQSAPPRADPSNVWI